MNFSSVKCFALALTFFGLSQAAQAKEEFVGCVTPAKQEHAKLAKTQCEVECRNHAQDTGKKYTGTFRIEFEKENCKSPAAFACFGDFEEEKK